LTKVKTVADPGEAVPLTPAKPSPLTPAKPSPDPGEAVPGGGLAGEIVVTVTVAVETAVTAAR
jgi:hypothetical protein